MAFRYNRWANAVVLAKASEVAEADYYATAAGLSFGSLHATLVHTLVAEIVWLRRFEHSLPPEELKDARRADELAVSQVPSLDVLRLMWQVEDAKQEMTRRRRIRRTQEELEEGQRRPCCWRGCAHRERTGR